MDKRPAKAIDYAVAIGNPDRRSNETSIYRAPQTATTDPRDFAMEFDTLHDVYRKTFTEKLDEDCIGARMKNPDGSLQNIFTWLSKQEVRTMADEMGSGFMGRELYNVNNEWEGKEMKLVAVYAKNSLHYLIVDIAMAMQGVTTVPIYDTLGREGIEFIFSQTKVKTCFVTANHVKHLAEQAKKNGYKHLKTLVVMDYENYDRSQYVDATKTFDIVPYEHLLKEGRKNILPWASVQPDTAYCISYTSGTAGTPKGAVLTHSNIISIFRGVNQRLDFNDGDIHLSYLSLAHIFERAAFKLFLSQGVKIGVFNGEVLKLKEDLAILQPTVFISVPRLFNKFYDSIMSTVRQTKGIKKLLVDRAVSTKLSNLQTSCKYSHMLYDLLVFNKIKKVLGGRVRVMMTASAPISVEVLNFLKIAFCCPIVEAYGQTEGTGAEFSTIVSDPLSGHVGGPFPHNEFKLVDVEEMNYTSSDRDENGAPRPRGEIWVRGPNIIPGYFLNEEENKATFTSDGWLKSGDIGQLWPDGNRLQIIDRKKNIFKLSQGEYIAPEKLENAYKLAHPLINDVFVYGDSLKSCLVAVVCIEKPNISSLARDLGLSIENHNLSDNQELKAALLELLNQTAKKRHFNQFEELRAVHIETKPFADLSLLTATFKKKRNAFKTAYKNVLDALYINFE